MSKKLDFSQEFPILDQSNLKFHVELSKKRALPTGYVVKALGNSDFCPKCFIWTQMVSWYPTSRQVAVFGDFGGFTGVKGRF